MEEAKMKILDANYSGNLFKVNEAQSQKTLTRFSMPPSQGRSVCSQEPCEGFTIRYLSDRFKRSERCMDTIFFPVLCREGGGILRVPLFLSNDAEEVWEWEPSNVHQDMCI
jgi:hypothetical protein